jgi:hypothetical protein
MDYATKHAKALQKVLDRGAPVTFEFTNPGELDDSTGTYGNPTTTSVAGQAAEIPADADEYNKLNLIEQSTVTLMFVPTTIGELPKLLSTVDWAGSKRRAEYVFPIRPAGVAIAARVLVTL